MKRTVGILGTLASALLLVSLAPPVEAQSTSPAAAKAIQISPSVGRPSTLALKENWLAMQIAAVKRDLAEAARCVADATNLQTLRDPQGNINSVPQNDILDCGRRVQQLTRKLESLTRQSEALARDSAAQLSELKAASDAAARAKRTQSVKPGSSGSGM